MEELGESPSWSYRRWIRREVNCWGRRGYTGEGEAWHVPHLEFPPVDARVGRLMGAAWVYLWREGVARTPLGSSTSRDKCGRRAVVDRDMGGRGYDGGGETRQGVPLIEIHLFLRL